MKGILPFAAAVHTVLQVFHAAGRLLYSVMNATILSNSLVRGVVCWSDSHLPPRPPSHWRSEHQPASWTGGKATTFGEKMNGTPAQNVLHCILFHLHKKSVLIH